MTVGSECPAASLSRSTPPDVLAMDPTVLGHLACLSFFTVEDSGTTIQAESSNHHYQ